MLPLSETTRDISLTVAGAATTAPPNETSRRASYDPRGPVYDYSRLACEAHRFYTRCVWRIDPIGERTCE